MYNMKKVMKWVMVAALMCGISLAAASCSKDDDDDIVPPVEQPDDNGANSGGDDDDNNNGLNDVNGNVDVNNGGGGVNIVR